MLDYRYNAGGQIHNAKKLKAVGHTSVLAVCIPHDIQNYSLAHSIDTANIISYLKKDFYYPLVSIFMFLDST